MLFEKISYFLRKVVRMTDFSTRAFQELLHINHEEATS